MEYPDTNSSLFDLNFSDNVKGQLKRAAVWAGIAAILSLATTIISGVLQFTGGNDATAKYKQMEGFSDTAMKEQTGAGIFSVVVSLAIAGLFFYFLNRFASLTKAGLASNDQEMVSNGLGSLATYFAILGIILIIVLGLCLLVVVGGVIIGASRM